MSSRRLLLAYALTVPLLGAAFALALELDELKVEAPYLILLPAILAIGLLGGIGPGLVAAMLGGIGTWYFFIPPVWSFDPPHAVDALSLALYMLVMVLVCLPVWRQRAHIRRLRRNWEELWKFTALLGEGSDEERRAAALAGLDPAALDKMRATERDRRRAIPLA